MSGLDPFTDESRKYKGQEASNSYSQRYISKLREEFGYEHLRDRQAGQADNQPAVDFAHHRDSEPADTVVVRASKFVSHIVPGREELRSSVLSSNACIAHGRSGYRNNQKPATAASPTPMKIRPLSRFQQGGGLAENLVLAGSAPSQGSTDSPRKRQGGVRFRPVPTDSDHTTPV